MLELLTYQCTLRVLRAVRVKLAATITPDGPGLNLRRCCAGSTTSTIRRCSTAQTLPDAGHTHAVIFFATQSDVRINCFSVNTPPAFRNSRSRSSSFSALPESLQPVGSLSLLLAAGHKVFVHGFARMDLVLDTIKTGISRAAKHRYGLAAGSGKRTSYDVLSEKKPPEYG